MMNDTLDRIENQIAENEATEKAKRDALPENEKQHILAENEKEQREKLIETWKNKGITERYFDASWEKWIADSVGKENAITKVKKAWKNNLFLTGKNGTGKTYLAMCLTKDGATYREASNIFREIRGDFDHEQEILDFYGSRKLLIIDEVGRQNKKELSDFEKNVFFEIINQRWNNCLPTTLITNIDKNEAASLLGVAILDRLRPIFVHFDWDSMRGKQ